MSAQVKPDPTMELEHPIQTYRRRNGDFYSALINAGFLLCGFTGWSRLTICLSPRFLKFSLPCGL